MVFFRVFAFALLLVCLGGCGNSVYTPPGSDDDDAANDDDSASDDDDSASDDDDSAGDDDDSAGDDDDSAGDDDDSAGDDDDSADDDDDDSAGDDDDDSADDDDDDSADDDDDATSDDDDSAAGDDDDSAAGDDDDSAAGDDDDSAAGAAMVFISEIAEPGAPTSGNAKFVEIYNGGTTSVQLDTYSLHRYANGSATSSSVALSGVLPPGAAFVTCNQAALCLTTYGITADLEAGNVVTGNGDDVYELQENGLIADTYGQVGVDGTGTNWQYVNTSVVRLPGSAPNLGVVPSDPSIPLDMSEWQLTAWVDALAAGTITPGAHTN